MLGVVCSLKARAKAAMRGSSSHLGSPVRMTTLNLYSIVTVLIEEE